MTLVCELRAVDRELQALFGVCRIQHRECQRFPIIAESRAYIQRTGIAAGIDCRWSPPAGNIGLACGESPVTSTGIAPKCSR